MHPANSAEKIKAVEEAVQQVKRAEEEAEKAEGEFITASNSLLEASEEHKSNLRTGKDLDARAKAVASNLGALKSGFAAAQSLVARFDLIVEHGKAGAALTVAGTESTEVAPLSKVDEQIEQTSAPPAQADESNSMDATTN